MRPGRSLIWFLIFVTANGQILVKEGSKVGKGTAVMNVTGDAREYPQGGKDCINIMMRMSGIATETRRIVDLAKGVTILATRKTAPGLRYFDKKAVVLGGGATHRMRLDDMVLIKDNHLNIYLILKNPLGLLGKMSARR